MSARDTLATFLRWSETHRDAFNTPQGNWPPLFSAWVHVKYLDAAEAQDGGATTEAVRIVLTVPSSGAARSLSSRDRVRVGGVDFEVTGARPGKSRAYRIVNATGLIDGNEAGF
jgi:hypothetical protein